MNAAPGPRARIFAALVAAVAVASLALQTALTIDDVTRSGGTVGDALAALLLYFTIIANLLVALAMAAVALGIWPGGRRPSAPALAGTALYIGLVGAVYFFMLRAFEEPSGWAAVANAGLHYAVPGLAVAYWLVAAPKRGLAWRHVFLWPILPLAYCVYALARGGATGEYPYPFMDLARLSAGQVALNIGGLTLAFMAAGAAFVAIGRIVGGRR